MMIFQCQIGMSYDLTTVKQPIRQMSKLVTQLIDDYIRDPDYEAINHIVRGSLN
jgi:DNA-binding LacI/PurR family transcriptional regulator